MMTRQDAIDTLSHELKLATLKGNTTLEEALKWAINDMTASGKWDKICQDLWIENEALEAKLATYELQFKKDTEADKEV